MKTIDTKKQAQKEFERKFGKVCKTCKLRTKTFFATKGAEGGRNSICQCNKK